MMASPDSAVGGADPAVCCLWERSKVQKKKKSLKSCIDLSASVVKQLLSVMCCCDRSIFSADTERGNQWWSCSLVSEEA